MMWKGLENKYIYSLKELMDYTKGIKLQYQTCTNNYNCMLCVTQFLHIPQG